MTFLFFYFFLKCTQASRKSVTPAGARMRWNGLWASLPVSVSPWWIPAAVWSAGKRKKKNKEEESFGSISGRLRQKRTISKKNKQKKKHCGSNAHLCGDLLHFKQEVLGLMKLSPRDAAPHAKHRLLLLHLDFFLWSTAARQAELLQTLPAISRKSQFFLLLLLLIIAIYIECYVNL